MIALARASNNPKDLHNQKESTGVGHDAPKAPRKVSSLLGRSCAAVARALRGKSRRRELAALDLRQLRDAGIDAACAGRGKAADVSVVNFHRLQGLTFS